MLGKKLQDPKERTKCRLSDDLKLCLAGAMHACEDDRAMIRALNIPSETLASRPIEGR